MENRVNRIPYPGGSGRVRTGPMVFEGDWPGYFIRGDELPLTLLKLTAKALRANADDVLAGMVERLSSDMKACIVGQDWPR